MSEELGLMVIWYDASNDQVFQSGLLEGLFCALAIRPGWFQENPHINIIGLVEER